MRAGCCGRCGYVGWAASERLTEDERRALKRRTARARARMA
jgi:hypothetical protein